MQLIKTKQVTKTLSYHIYHSHTLHKLRESCIISHYSFPYISRHTRGISYFIATILMIDYINHPFSSPRMRLKFETPIWGVSSPNFKVTMYQM